ncbi:MULTISPECIES: Type 1 glutamine amidotransferase-like domain-containing protein [Anaerococcus]|uniref:Type 1 glutamine amidotransferase-like domain-containing protein n=2 Tax=Anaerococcus TaxID=165779 RepID=A0ABW9MV59_9FIRM
MNIFLSSSLVGAKNGFERFIEKYQAREITFVATAAEVSPYTQYVDDAREYFIKKGFEIKDLKVNKLEQSDAKEIISDTEILYVSGGNTFYLLQELKKKNLLELIKERVDKGMVYVGESAGSIIASPNIEYIKYMDDPKAAPELKSTTALNLVEFYPLPHWGEEPFEEAAEKIHKTYADTLPIWVINNKSSISHLKENEYGIDFGD